MNTAMNMATEQRSAGVWLTAWRRFKGDRVGMVSMVVVLAFLLLIAAASAGWVASQWQRELGVPNAPPTLVGPRAAESAGTLAGPESLPGKAVDLTDIDPLAPRYAEWAALAAKEKSVETLPLGGDRLGRDVLSKTIKGTEISVFVGVLAAVLANRGITKVVATDNSHRALDCALFNINQLGLKNNVALVEADLYPKIDYGNADLIVCNPPWLPAHPSSALESAVYDEKSKMLKGFLNGLNARLSKTGEGWLILSDFAEHLGLRTREELLSWIENAGLTVIDRIDTKAKHSKTLDASDPLHAARKAEVTSLWRLGRI